MLNPGSSQTSAKIYQFPAGGRASLGGRPYGDATASAATAPRLTEALSYDSWYHQAAIEEAQPVRDH
ncbi:MAG: DUF2735 domain-containing protein [Bradyrhizobium sp.]|nr:DUF2735 domain-containing protein [Bradyrhizobium sp.]